MFSKTLTLSGSSLSLLQPGDRGTVLNLGRTNSPIAQKLAALGLTPGMDILVEQQSPTYIVQAAQTRLTLDRQTAHSIYVRLKP